MNEKGELIMADIKTNLRELSVATTVGLLRAGISFQKEELYNSACFLTYAKRVISSDISIANNLGTGEIFTGELKKIIDNGYQLGKAIYENKHFHIDEDSKITWQGNDTQKDDPIDITIGDYGFSLKEESFILENMGLYKLLNCYTGSDYKKRHIFSDYARAEYESWFTVTWEELVKTITRTGIWSYNDVAKQKNGKILFEGNVIKFEYFLKGKLEASSVLPKDCNLSTFENNTSSKTREQVFSKYIKLNLENNTKYNTAKNPVPLLLQML